MTKNFFIDFRPFVTTFFEPIYARRVFPCFDEPNFKATFDLSVNHPINYTVHSNMPVKKRSIKDRYATTTFETTPLMSTYLLQFLISNFKNVSRNNINVVTIPKYLNFSNFSLELSEKVIKEMENYTNLRYNMNKLDLVCLPHTFPTALENWGIITFYS